MASLYGARASAISTGDPPPQCLVLTIQYGRTYIKDTMPRPSHRAKILTEGLRVVHEHGFGGSSVRDIVQAAGVPQGSFTNHFASKEAFGLEIIELYLDQARDIIAATLRNDELPPLARLGAFVDVNKIRLNRKRMRNGCLFGNFTAEACDHSEAIRHRLVEIFAEMQQAVAYCLR